MRAGLPTQAFFYDRRVLSATPWALRHTHDEARADAVREVPSTFPRA